MLRIALPVAILILREALGAFRLPASETGTLEVLNIGPWTHFIAEERKPAAVGMPPVHHLLDPAAWVAMLTWP